MVEPALYLFFGIDKSERMCYAGGVQTQMTSPSTAMTTIDPTRTFFPSQLVVLLGRSKELYPLILHSLLARSARGRRVGVVVGHNRLHARSLTLPMNPPETSAKCRKHLQSLQYAGSFVFIFSILK